MSISTKGIVITENKDCKEIMSRIQAVIEKVPCEKVREFGPSKNWSPTIEYRPKENFFKVHFFDGELKRIFWVFLECDCDNKQLAEKSLTFYFGCFGNSVEIMRNVLAAFKDFGPCYLQENDCGDDPILVNL